MRVSQIQNLTWAASVLVAGGVVWVGFGFWQVKKAVAAPAPEWETAKASTEDASKRWPGELRNFDPIWKTWVNGKVPPPPEVAKPKEAQVDKVAIFKSKLAYHCALDAVAQPENTILYVRYDGKPLMLRIGASLDGFQLVQYTGVEKPDPTDPNRKIIAGRMIFTHPDTGLPVEVEQDPPRNPMPANTSDPGLVGAYNDLILPAVPENGPLERTAYRDPASGDWVLPLDEVSWILAYGEKKVLANLATKPEVDAQGVARGLRLVGFPEQGTPLAKVHGLTANDVILSINGFPIRAKEDIALYLRGPGRGLEVYKVVLATPNGSERSVTYRVQRPH